MNILIVKTSSLGDIIHAFPVLIFLKNKFPDATIDFVVEKPFAELVLNHPNVSHVIQVSTREWRKSFSNAVQGIKKLRADIRQKKYDVCFDLQCNMKSGFIVSQVIAKDKVGFGFKTAIEWPNCFFNRIRYNPAKDCNVRDENLYIIKEYYKSKETELAPDVKLKISFSEKEIIENILKHPAICKKPKVLVCPGSIWKNKQITPDAMIGFLEKLQEHLECSFIFAWGSPNEKEYVQELESHFPQNGMIIDKLSLATLQNLMSEMQLVIAMDSLPLHLAGTTSVSTFSFFGPSNASKFMPIGDAHKAFQGTCPYGRNITRRCPVTRTCKTGACLRTVTSDQLFQSYLSQTIFKHL